MTTRRYSTLLEQEETAAAAAVAAATSTSATGATGGGGGVGLLAPAAVAAAEQLLLQPSSSSLDAGEVADTAGPPPAKVARGWSSTTQTMPPRLVGSGGAGGSCAGSPLFGGVATATGPGGLVGGVGAWCACPSPAQCSPASCAAARAAAAGLLLQPPQGVAFPLPSELWGQVLSYLPLRAMPLATLLDLMSVGACAR